MIILLLGITIFIGPPPQGESPTAWHNKVMHAFGIWFGTVVSVESQDADVRVIVMPVETASTVRPKGVQFPWSPKRVLVKIPYLPDPRPIENVLLHEAGHCAGLPHRPGIMDPVNPQWNAQDSIDAKRLQELIRQLEQR